VATDLAGHIHPGVSRPFYLFASFRQLLSSSCCQIQASTSLLQASGVRIGEPDLQLGKAPHCGSKQHQRSFQARSLYYSLFAPHTHGCDSLRTSRS